MDYFSRVSSHNLGMLPKMLICIFLHKYFSCLLTLLLLTGGFSLTFEWQQISRILFCILDNLNSSSDLQFPLSLFQTLEDCFKGTIYNWYYHHFHVSQLFQHSDKIQECVCLYTFFHFHFMLGWNIRFGLWAKIGWLLLLLLLLSILVFHWGLSDNKSPQLSRIFAKTYMLIHIFHTPTVSFLKFL